MTTRDVERAIEPRSACGKVEGSRQVLFGGGPGWLCEACERLGHTDSEEGDVHGSSSEEGSAQVATSCEEGCAGEASGEDGEESE